jgi:4-amino-4-deoxy-L-arabinose transferase-like glycosyltransferase
MTADRPNSSAARHDTVKVALTLLTLLTLFRLWYITKLGLVGDEAYYWLWSKHLAASYTDKGPGIAWLIAAGTSVFGDTPFGVRWLGVLMCAGTGWQIFRLAQRLYDDRTALWALVITCVIPIFGVGTVIMTIDTPSVFCWAWAANVFWTALETGKVRHWFGLGLIIGAGFLAKFTNGVQLGCIGLFLLWSAPHRKFIFSRQSLALAVAFGLCSLPVIWWNYSVGWLQVEAVHSRSGVKNSFGIHPLQLIQFLGEQIGIISPLIAVGMIIAAFGLLISRHRDPRVRFLLCQFLPVYGLFCFFSLNAAGKGNWPVPALVGGIVLVAVYWREKIGRQPGWRWAAWTALILAGVMTLGLHLATFVNIPVVNKLMNRTQGWPDYAAHIERARAKYHATLLIGDHYSTVSLAQFYLPDHPTVYQPTGWHPQFKLWGGYQLAPGTRALFITSGKKNPKDKTPLAQEFNPPELADDFWAQENGRDIKEFHIYFLVARDPNLTATNHPAGVP